MIKKLLFASLLLLPSSAFADRLGGIKSSIQVPLSSQTFRDGFGSGLLGYATHYTVGTVEYSIPLGLYGRSAMTGGRVLVPVYQNVGFGDSLVSYYGYNYGGTGGAAGYEWLNSSLSPVFKMQYGNNSAGATGITGFGIIQGATYLKNSLDITGSFGVGISTTATSVSLSSSTFVMLVDATSADVVLNLPDLDQSSLGVERRWYKVCKIDTSTNVVAFTDSASDTIDPSSIQLTVQNECVDIIGRVGVNVTGSISAGIWSEFGRSVRGGIYGNSSISGDLYVSGTIGTGTGGIGLQGSTLTFTAPPIDTTDRIMVVNNGNVSFPAMANGAIQDADNTFSQYNSFTSTRGASVTYGATVGSATVNDLTASRIVATDANKKLASVTATDDSVIVMNGSGYDIKTIPDCDTAVTSKLLYDQATNAFTCGTDQNTGGSGSGYQMEPATVTIVAAQGINMSGANITNGGQLTISTIQYSANGQTGFKQYWSTKPWASGDISTLGVSTNPIPGFSATLQANATYFFEATLLISNSGTGGYKAALDVPAGCTFRIVLFGDGGSATAIRAGDRIDTDRTVNTNAHGTYGNGNHYLKLTGSVNMGASAGTVELALVAMSSTSSQTIKTGSYMFLERRDP